MRFRAFEIILERKIFLKNYSNFYSRHHRPPGVVPLVVWVSGGLSSVGVSRQFPLLKSVPGPKYFRGGDYLFRARAIHFPAPGRMFFGLGANIFWPPDKYFSDPEWFRRGLGFLLFHVMKLVRRISFRARIEKYSGPE